MVSRDPSEMNPRGSLRRARYIQAVVFGVIGIVLAVALLHAFAVVDAVFRNVATGEGERLFHGVRMVERPEETLSAGMLESVIAAQWELGLRCIALFDRRGQVTTQAGQCETPKAGMEVAFRQFRPGDATRIGPRFRMVDRPPPPPGAGGPPPPGRLDRPPPGPDGWDAPPPPLGHADLPPPPAGMGPPPHQAFLIEFEPVLANRLRASVVGSVLAGIAASALLVSAVVVFWRMSVRAERLQLALERDRRLAGLGEMSAVLAHEIRNPLASLKGHAQLLLEMVPADSRYAEKAGRVVREAVRLESLCEDLLSLVRSSRVERVAVDPASLLREAAAAVDDGSFKIDSAGAPSQWPLDPVRMHQVLANLLRNALQASPNGTRPHATVGQEDGALVFTVRDFGGGVPPGEEERIFEPFHTTRTRGTGLGLAVARRIAELHGGTISLRNHPAGGAEFRVVIPAA